MLQRGILEGKRVWPEGVAERLTQEHAKPPQEAESAYGYGVAIARKRAFSSGSTERPSGLRFSVGDGPRARLGRLCPLQ